MFKGKRNQEVNEEMNEQEAADLAGSLGQADETMEAKLEEFNPFETIPCFTPGKPGFEAGKVFAGTYLETKRIYSDKFTAGKRDEQGKLYRDQHILKDKNGKKFAFWSVGQLGYIFSELESGKYVKVMYEGKADKALKAGQSPSHMFKVFTTDPYKKEETNTTQAY